MCGLIFFRDTAIFLIHIFPLLEILQAGTSSSIYIYTCPVNIHCKFNLGLRSITFSIKINMFPTFSEISNVWQWVKLCLYGQRSSHT